jgi:hypothetical protein
MRVPGRVSLLHEEPPSVVTSAAATPAIVEPSAVQSDVVAQDTARSVTPVGALTTCSDQVDPPSDVVMTGTVPAAALELAPTATQSVGEPQATASGENASGWLGTVSLVQFAPKSAVVKMPSPTATQSEADEHDTSSRRGSVVVFADQVDPPSLVESES